MSAISRAATPSTRGRAVNVTLWVLQGVFAAIFAIPAAIPKLVGAQSAVEIFAEIGIGQWFRYLVGVLELAGAIGLLIPRLAGLAALGLVGVMVGAAVTQVVVLGSPLMALTPVVFGVLLALVAWGRWPETRELLGKLKR